MKRWWLVVLLLLSVGLNLGLLAQRVRAEKKAAATGKVPEAPTDPVAAPAQDPTPEGPTAGPVPAGPAEGPAAGPATTTGPEPRDRRRPREKPPFLVKLMNRMANEVGVEGEQREKFVAIQESFFERTFDKRELLRRRQDALRENLVSPNPDRELAKRQVEEMSWAQKELEQAFLDNYFESTAILDQEQQRRYRRLILELRKMRWERGGRQDEIGPPGGPPGEGPWQQRRRERREAREREREAREGDLRERPPRPPGGG